MGTVGAGAGVAGRSTDPRPVCHWMAQDGTDHLVDAWEATERGSGEGGAGRGRSGPRRLQVQSGWETSSGGGDSVADREWS